MGVVGDGAGGGSVGDGSAPKWLRKIFVANLVAQTGIVITGGLVRLTGSGLGCPSWPQCTPGSYVPVATAPQGFHKYIEFGNRSLTAVLGVLAIAAIACALSWNYRNRKNGGHSRRAVVLLAAVPLAGTFVQAILGGITVLTGLHPVTVAIHFLLSAGLIAACLLLVVRAGETADQPITLLVRPVIRQLGRIMVALVFVVLILGTIVTGSGPHSGDADATNRLPFDPRSVSSLHAGLVLIFIGLVIGMIVALSITNAPATARTRAWILLVVTLLQGVIGYTQYFTGLPWLVVALHLFGACLVWISVIALQLSLRRRGSQISTRQEASPFV